MSVFKLASFYLANPCRFRLPVNIFVGLITSFSIAISSCAPLNRTERPLPKTKTEPAQGQVPPAQSNDTGVERTGGGGEFSEGDLANFNFEHFINEYLRKLSWIRINEMLRDNPHSRLDATYGISSIFREVDYADKFMKISAKLLDRAPNKMTIYDALKIAEISINREGPCVYNGEEKMASAHFEPKPIICLSLPLVKKNLPRAQTIEQALSALGAHEFSHLAGLDEAEAKWLQRVLLARNLNETHLSLGYELSVGILPTPFDNYFGNSGDLNSLSLKFKVLVRKNNGNFDPIVWKQQFCDAIDNYKLLETSFDSKKVLCEGWFNLDSKEMIGGYFPPTIYPIIPLEVVSSATAYCRNKKEIGQEALFDLAKQTVAALKTTMQKYRSFVPLYFFNYQGITPN